MKALKPAVFAIMTAAFLLGIFEGTLRFLAIGVPGDDPYLDISGEIPLFQRVGDYYETQPDKVRLFRQERFDAIKPDGLKRVFCIGGSVVNGFPYGPAGAWPELMERGLNAVEPGSWEIVNASGIAHASYRELRIFKEVLDYSPDAIVVMSGHNEFLEKRIYSEQLNLDPRIKSARTALAKFHIFNLVRKFVANAPEPEKTVLGEKIDWNYAVRDEKQKKLTEDHYRHSLARMAQLGKERGVPVIFATLPCNLKDYPPLGGDGEDPAGVSFKAGEKLLKEKKIDEAYAAFRKAADLDSHPVRAFSSYNEIVRELGRQSRLADVEAAFIAMSGGIPGNDLFLDHVHFRSEGAAIAASVVIEALAEAGLLNQGLVKNAKSSVSGARKFLGPEEEAKARYGAAYEAFRYLNRPAEARKLLEEAIALYRNFPDAYQLLEELPKKRVPRGGDDEDPR